MDAEAAREQQHVRAGERALHHAGQTGGVVAHGDLVERPVAERSQMAGDELRVGIDDLPHEQLRADGDDFRNHAPCTTFLFLTR